MVAISYIDMYLSLMPFSLQAIMSGIKRKLEGNDPDYEDISLLQNNKRNKTAEYNGRL